MDDNTQVHSVSRETSAYVTAAIVLAWAVMVFLVRVYLRFSIKRSFAADDLACTVGMLFGIGSTVATFVGIKNGLGKHINSLSPTQLDKFTQSFYAASLLYILALSASKCSTALLVSRLKPGQRHILVQNWLPFLSIIWGVISTFIVAFQCDLPRPWEGQCSHLFTKWAVIEVFSCAIEAMLFSLAVKIMWDLRMKWSSKVVVLLILASRLLIIIPTGVRIYYLHESLSEPDYTFQGMNLVITTQVVLHYSLMAATFPCLKPFLAAFDKDLWHASNLEPSGGFSFLRSRQTHDNKGYVLHSIDKENITSASAKFSSMGGSTHTDVERAPRITEHSVDPDSSGPMIIRKTQEWEIHHESKP